VVAFIVRRKDSVPFNKNYHIKQMWQEACQLVIEYLISVEKLR